MVRNFVTGVMLGGVVAAGGLVLVSQVAPLRGQGAEPAREGLATAPAEAAKPEVTPATENPAPAKAAAQPKVAEPGPLVAVLPEVLPETDEPLLRPLATDDAPPPASVVPDLNQPAKSDDSPAPAASVPAKVPEPQPDPTAGEEAGVAGTPQSDTPQSEAPTTEVPATGVAPQGSVTAEAPVATKPMPSVLPATPETSEPEALPSESAVVDEAEKPPVSASPAVEPEAETATPDTPSTEPPVQDLPDTSGEATAEAAPEASTIAPDAQLGDAPVAGVTTGRLPSIGAEPAPPAEADATEAAPALQPEAPGELPPVVRFARTFDNPDSKPLFAILLIDSGAPDVPRADLAALPFPVTFVLDPLAAGAAEAQAIYRAAGQEVVMLASAIPQGATASDLEQSFAGLEGKLPEAVALIDTVDAGFQDDRKLSAEVVTHLADKGLGLVTFDRGLNAADQVARREGLPAATIFRSLDDDGEEAPLIRRYLDRAAFKAAQEGEVAVIGTARPETIAALMEWAVEGRASSVALAPITALMAP